MLTQTHIKPNRQDTIWKCDKNNIKRHNVAGRTDVSPLTAVKSFVMQ